MGSIISLKKFFRQTRERADGFKRAHFLNQMPAHKREEILLFSEGDYLTAALPTFAGKRVAFFNDQRHKYIFRKILAEEPAHLVNYVYRGNAVTEQSPGYRTVMGDAESPALRRGHFDVVICPFVLEDAGFVDAFVRTLSPMVENGSRIILSVRHPQLDSILLNQNPASARVAESSVSRYHALLKECGLFTEEIREGVVDLALKAFFTEPEYDYYHEYKNTGMSLVFRAVKFVRKK